MDPMVKPISMLFSNKSTQRWLYQAADSCTTTRGAKYWNSFQDGRPRSSICRLQEDESYWCTLGLRMDPGNCKSQSRFIMQYMLPLCVISQVSAPGLMTSTTLASSRKVSWSIVRPGSTPSPRKTLLFQPKTFCTRKRAVCRLNSALDLWTRYCVAQYARSVAYRLSMF